MSSRDRKISTWTRKMVSTQGTDSTSNYSGFAFIMLRNLGGPTTGLASVVGGLAGGGLAGNCPAPAPARLLETSVEVPRCPV